MEEMARKDMDSSSFIIQEMPGGLFKNGITLYLVEGELQCNIEKKEEIEIISEIEDLMDIIIIKDLVKQDKVMDMEEISEGDIDREEIDIIKEIKYIIKLLI